MLNETEADAGAQAPCLSQSLFKPPDGNQLWVQAPNAENTAGGEGVRAALMATHVSKESPQP